MILYLRAHHEMQHVMQEMSEYPRLVSHAVGARDENGKLQKTLQWIRKIV